MKFNYQLRSAPKRLWTLWFAVAAFGLVIALLWLTAYRNATAEVIQAANSESQNANRTFADHSAWVMRQVDAVIRGVRSTYLRTGSVGATEQFIADLNIDPSFIENVYLIDAQGQIVIPAKDRARNLSAVGRDYFTFHSKTTKDTPFLTTVNRGQVTGKYQFRMTRRISLPDGTFAGVVLVPIEPNAFTNYYKQLLPSGDHVATLMAITDKKARARMPPPTTPEGWQIQSETPVWQLLESRSEGSYTAQSPVDGIERQVFFQRVPDWPLVMLTGYSGHDTEKRLQERMAYLNWIAAGSWLAVVALAIALSIIMRQRDDMQKLANVDALTGVLSRRSLLAHGEEEFRRAQRYQTPMSVLMLDLDHFKQVNDKWGHAVGDLVLKNFAGILQTEARSHDWAGRLGGEEFLLILPHTDPTGAMTIAERVRQSIENNDTQIKSGAAQIHITASNGMSSVGEDDLDFAALMERADRALYSAKSSGRNRICEA